MRFDNAPPFGGLDFFKVIILGLALIAAQGAVLPWPGGAAPEMAAILVVYVAWRTEKWMAVLAAFILGLFRDMAGGGLLGLYQVTLILMAWVFHAWRRRFHLEIPLALMLCVFGLTLGGNILVLTPLMVLSGWPQAGFDPLPAFLGSSIFSALAAPPLFWLLRRLTGGQAHG